VCHTKKWGITKVGLALLLMLFIQDPENTEIEDMLMVVKEQSSDELYDELNRLFVNMIKTKNLLEVKNFPMNDNVVSIFKN